MAAKKKRKRGVATPKQIRDAELLVLDKLAEPLRYLSGMERFECERARILFFALHKAGLLSTARRVVTEFYGHAAELWVKGGDEYVRR